MSEEPPVYDATTGARTTLGSDADSDAEIGTPLAVLPPGFVIVEPEARALPLTERERHILTVATARVGVGYDLYRCQACHTITLASAGVVLDSQCPECSRPLRTFLVGQTRRAAQTICRVSAIVCELVPSDSGGGLTEVRTYELTEDRPPPEPLADGTPVVWLQSSTPTARIRVDVGSGAGAAWELLRLGDRVALTITQTRQTP